ncbi:putative ABC transporter ATP-binding protein YxlF [Anaerolineales bacterium]|nr:putative ABC transporter ATP-binding protein YxlF [Anaerolineales bacterium]
MNAIEVQGLSKVFTKKLTTKVRALNEVTFSVGAGSTFGFIGPNGAGKSTSIKILMGLLQASSGTALIFGQSSCAPSSRKTVGYLAENPAYYDYLTPRELLVYVGRNFGLAESVLKGRVDETLQTIDLSHAADRPIRSLSKGMVQRIGLGQTLVHDPDLYILDEPMSGLDPLGRRLVADIILDLKKKGKTVFFSTHIIHDVERICDDVAIILDGEIRYTGAVRDVVNESFSRYEVLLRHHTPACDEIIATFDATCERESDHVRMSIARDVLGQCLAVLHRQNEILAVEPQRKGLEEIFLDLVRTGHHGQQ